MISVDQLTSKKTDLLKSEIGSKIYCKLFNKRISLGELSKELYPHLYERISKKEYKKGRPHSTVSKFVNAFKELNWLEIKKDGDEKKTVYQGTLQPYFEHNNQKNLNKKQIQIITSLISNSKLNESLNFYSQIDNIIRDAIQSYFTLNFKNILNLNLKENDDFPLYISLANKYLDEFTLTLMREYVLLKMRANKDRGLKIDEALYWMFHHDLGYKRLHI
ncbi:MAG: hypothetical protein PHT27_07690, partial [Candidatus Izemoplasmatales bacterium]|nr:hypothetical protein [Candidatus Izemoplasmatales bacterium]